MNKKELEKIERDVAREFPEDTALQQVHIARKLIAAKAKALGMTYFEYLMKVAQPRPATQASR